MDVAKSVAGLGGGEEDYAAGSILGFSAANEAFEEVR